MIGDLSLSKIQQQRARKPGSFWQLSKLKKKTTLDTQNILIRLLKPNLFKKKKKRKELFTVREETERLSCFLLNLLTRFIIFLNKLPILLCSSGFKFACARFLRSLVYYALTPSQNKLLKIN